MAQQVIVQDKLSKIVHQEGHGLKPTKGQEIFALYKGTLQTGEEFDSNQDRDSPFTFVLGQGSVIKGWDQGFASMNKGEKATLICSPEYAYGAKGSPPRIPPNATLHFEVELLDFKDKQKEKWELSQEEKVEKAVHLKTTGNEHLLKGEAKLAIVDYKEGIQFVESEENAPAKQILLILRLNIAQAYLKAGNYNETVTACTKVLKDSPHNLKALYRRGIAYGKTGEFDAAKTDLHNILQIEPQNEDARRELTNVFTAAKLQKEKEKKVFGSLFSKGGLYDDKKMEPVKDKPVQEMHSQEEGMEQEPKRTEDIPTGRDKASIPPEEPLQTEDIPTGKDIASIPPLEEQP